MEREGIKINAIYQHFKGDYYRVIDVARHHEHFDDFMVIYHKCDENGVFKSIREKLPSFSDPEPEYITHQPFYRILSDFVGYVVGGYPGSPAIPRFKFVKQLNS